MNGHPGSLTKPKIKIQIIAVTRGHGIRSVLLEKNTERLH